MKRKTKRTPFDWGAWKQTLLSHHDVFDPLREYLEWHFADAERIKLEERPVPGYERRPTIGLRLQLPANLTLAIRPGWTPPRLRYSDDPADPRLFGRLHTDVVMLELLGPNKLMTLTLREGEPPRAGWTPYNPDVRATRLRTILDTAHDLLMDPADVFSRQADKCCCCGKALTDVVSRTRGIGPECIRMFGSFTEFAERPDAVAKYRRKYLQETGFLPGL